MAKIKPSSAKDKGRRLQKWVAEKISELTGLPWGKDCPIESRPMGQSGSDIRLDDNAVIRFPFDVECKYQETWSVPAWIDQAKKNRRNDHKTDWLLVMRRNRYKAVVVLDAKVFFKLLSRIPGVVKGPKLRRRSIIRKYTK